MMLIVRHASQMRRVLAGALVTISFLGCASRQPGLSPDPARADLPVDQRVDELRLAVKRIDALDDSRSARSRRQLAKTFPHWQFSGLSEKSGPVLLRAVFSEGRVVRSEAYYLANSLPFFVRIEQWSDADDASVERTPRVRQDIFIENGQGLRRRTDVGSSPVASTTDDTPEPAATFAERARLIERILLDGGLDPDSLREYPEAELFR